MTKIHNYFSGYGHTILIKSAWFQAGVFLNASSSELNHD